MNTYRYTRNTMLLNMYVMARDGVSDNFSVNDSRFTCLHSSSAFREAAFRDLISEGFLDTFLKVENDGSSVRKHYLTAKAMIRIERYLSSDDVRVGTIGWDDEGDEFGPKPHEIGNQVNFDLLESFLGLEA